MENDLRTEKAVPQAPPPARRLRRTTQGRMIAGVCSGAAEYLGVDANILRLVLGVFTLFGGSGVAAYVLGWLLIPEEGRETSIAQDLIDKNRDNPVVQDAVAKTKEALNKTKAAR
ncbi:Phage shock protein PspC (stress-responsive transcriptional regulator) [Thermomonospora echinospora]|uniref:Phage shock protein PspC (Stress-responsive transcriptional regulator) n=1 Tax=Thermomonospora echinospora TaxID=1992 RepID=A0A1H6CZG7_9ACTN|nr:PspC domain-containing protein [Thermomonospora echinospora]SEG77965.1 Phage shock protein PspC (stress-responsive transcriptional regulator) [Thermomonospora echinospora]